MKPRIEARIKEAFKEYKGTTLLLEHWLRNRKRPHEIVILACARLDALANLAMTKKRSQHERFVSFLRNYSGKGRQLELVAVPNLYLRLFLHHATLSATIPTPGHLFSIDPARDLTFLQFLVDSGVPIEEKAVSKLLHKLSVWLQQRYRTTATQSTSKPYQDSPVTVMAHLAQCSRSYRHGFYDKAIAVLNAFIKEFRFADIMYRDYRSRSIHGFSFDLDHRFFIERRHYLATLYHAWETTRFLEVTFSARWIVDIYRESLAAYERSLVHRKKLPLDLWVRLCDEINELDFLDEDSVEMGKDLRIRVDR